MNKPGKIKTALLFSRFLKLALLFTTILIAITWYLYSTKVDVEINQLKSKEQSKLLLQVNEIKKDFVFVQRDVLLLSDLVSTSDFASCNNKKSIESIKAEIYQFIKRKKIYDQIRLLDVQGREVLRCDYQNGIPEFKPDSLLQDKSDRYYFKEISKLKNEDIYFSRFDLNIENGVLETPNKQLLRVGSKIYGCNNQYSGILIASYLGNPLEKRIKKLNQQHSGDFYLLDQSSFFLMSPNEDDNWGFMFADKQDKTFSNKFPKFWVLINTKEHGQLESNEGIITFSTLNFNKIISKGENLKYFASDDYWKVISFVPNHKIQVLKSEILANFYLPVGVIFFLILVSSYFFSYLQEKEQIAQEEVRKLASVVKNSNNCMLITDLHGRIEWLNPAYEKLINKPLDSVTGESYKVSIIDKNNPKNPTNLIDKAIKNKEQIKVEVVNYYQPKQENWQTIQIKPILSGKLHKAQKILFVGTDITDIKEKEKEITLLNNDLEQRVISRTKELENANLSITKNREKLKQSKNRLENAFLTGGYAWWEWNYTTDKLKASSLLYKKLGYKTEATINTFEWLLKKVHPDDIANVKENLKSFFKNKEAKFSFNCRLITQENNYLWFHLKGKIESFTTDNNPKKLIGTIQDISILKKAEVEITKAKNAAEDSNKAKSEFLANMSHEIRTPLNAIIGFSEQLSNTIKDNKQSSQIKIIHSSSKNLLRIINDILDLSKIEAGKIDIDAAPVDVRNIGQQMKDVFSQKVEKKEIYFDVVIDNKLPKLLIVDETRIRQVLFNLISNAVKFTENGGVQLLITATKETTDSNFISLGITVKDTGIGIPKEQRDQIFEPFIQRRGQNVIKYGGTGLGLSITTKLIKAMNGFISLESHLGKGSSFTVTLPKVEISYETTKEKEIPFDCSTILFNKAKVLVVDDVKQNRDLILDLFSNSPDLELYEAENGQQGIEIATQIIPDIIFMDLRMPVLNGCDAALEIKKNNTTKDIPIFAITASIKDHIEKEQLKNCFDEYIVKPIDIKSFFSKTSKYLAYNNISSSNLKKEKEYSFTDIEIKQLPALIHKLEFIFLTQLPTLLENNIINEMETFGQEILSLSKTYNNKYMIAYAEKICQHAENFEFDDLTLLLKKLPNKIKKLKSYLP
ncbi:ATP-binding protein [Wenyingzhuangia aestuarii]|uniref:ATP-binding protein n=1 Tax=Wenyingzhuangia aestuarii TaxID=1647582 RepID=UPI00143BC824|nr:ATP-binding protein [Wenyingzhuangia aestuarii]NJB82386.1 signal transduction histidine kinase/CheY-like chemotaxis protein [Wenyingzhuangia aestuarii]